MNFICVKNIWSAPDDLKNKEEKIIWSTPDKNECRRGKKYLEYSRFKKNVFQKEISGVLQIMHLESTFCPQFIETSVKRENNFFLYLVYHHPHHPQFSGNKFFNQSSRGSFGDSLLELDWSVGKILDTLDQVNERENTIILFTSDNGPSIARHQRGGCAGLLKCVKGTYEGGVRVPGMVSYPNVISSGVMTDVFSMLDVLPNILNLVDGSRKQIASSNRCFLYFPDSPQPDKVPYAIRCGPYKAHVYTKGSSLSDDTNPDPACHGSAKETRHSPPLLFNLDTVPGERWDISHDLPDLARELEHQLEVQAASVSWAPSEMEKGNSHTATPCCNVQPCEPGLGVVIVRSDYWYSLKRTEKK